MNRRTMGSRSADPTSDDAPPAPSAQPDAIDFVRFCYRRRRVGWPELYDEMCGVANRGLYRGLCADDLAAIGIGFSLFEMPSLAVLVARVVAEDQERRHRTAAAISATLPSEATAAGEPADAVTDHEITETIEDARLEVPSAEPVRVRLAVPAGA